MKAYLIVTSEYKRSTEDFLPARSGRPLAGRPRRRPGGGETGPTQFEFFANDLKDGNPYRTANDAGSIDQARRYLAQFSGIDRVYNFMLVQDSKANPKINFNEQFPGSAQVVVNNRDVPGAFTKKGGTGCRRP